MTMIDLKKEMLSLGTSRALAWLKKPLKLNNLTYMFGSSPKKLTTIEEIERYMGSNVLVEEHVDGTFDMYLQPKVQILVYIKDILNYINDSILEKWEKNPNTKKEDLDQISKSILNDDTIEFCFVGASSIVNITDDDILMVELFYDDENGRRCAKHFDMSDDDIEELIGRLYK